MTETAPETSKTKSKGPVIDAALCRCCRSIKKCRLINHEYDWNGSKEIYSEMFMDTFGLLLSHLDDTPVGRGVCATCVLRLREAAAFRQQVLQCEEALLQARLTDNDTPRVKSEPDSDSDTPLAAFDTRPPPSPSPEPELKPEVDLRLDSEPRSKPKAVRRKGQRALFSNIKDLKRERKRGKTKPKTEENNDFKLYMNAINMIKNSYICPFHNRVSMYYCFYCKEQFTNPEELREHTMGHDTSLLESSMENKKVPKVDVTRIDCRHCPESIADIQTLRHHLKAHKIQIYDVTNEFLTFKLAHNNVTCTECGQIFPYFDTLKKHMIEHFGTYVCDQCGACFLEQTSLRTHIKSHSRVEANFPCEICGKNLKSKYSRYLHIATIHEKKPTVNCYKCDASFLSYALRNRHLIEVHGDDRTFQCKLCDKVYNRRKTLMEHNRRNHLKVMKHQCELCSQRFYLPSRLKEHMANHTGGKSYRCSCCDKTFTRLLTLHQHLRDKARDT